MTPVDAVLFDLDDTLCAYRRSGAELLAPSFEAVGVEPFFSVGEYHARYDANLGVVAEMDALRERCFAELADAAGRDPEVGRAVARAYAAEREQTAVEALPGVPEVVEALTADHALGLVTNGPPEMQRPKLAAVGLDDAFETAVFAGFDAPAKPDPEPFDRALSALGVAPGRTVHVGNSPSTDVAGAHAAGIRSAWLRQDGATPDPEPDYVLDAPADLADPPW